MSSNLILSSWIESGSYILLDGLEAIAIFFTLPLGAPRPGHMISSFSKWPKLLLSYAMTSVWSIPIASRISSKSSWPRSFSAKWIDNKLLDFTNPFYVNFLANFPPRANPERSRCLKVNDFYKKLAKSSIINSDTSILSNYSSLTSICKWEGRTNVTAFLSDKYSNISFWSKASVTSLNECKGKPL